MLFLLRNNRFRVPLMVILLVLFTVPENANGLKCYSCDNCPIPAETDSKDCDGVCLSSGTKRGCISKDKVDCFMAAAGGECYNPMADTDKSTSPKVKECTGEDPAPAGPTCICYADNCRGVGVASGADGAGSAEQSDSRETGGRCYECIGTDDVGCKRNKWVEKFCPGSGGYCVVIKSGTKVGRGCVPTELDAECHIEVTGGLGCFDYGKDDNKYREYRQCGLRKISSTGFPSSGEPAAELCYCKGEFCNDNEAAGVSPEFLLITIVSVLCILF